MLIKSTVRGFLGNIIGNIILMVLGLAIAQWLNSYVNGHLDWHGLDSIWDAGDILHLGSPLPYVAYGIKWFIYLIVAAGAYEIGHNVLYDARQTNQLHADGENWSKIVKREYAFPAARKTNTAVINRVTEVNVSESTIDRLCGTGTLRLKLTVFLNATEAQIEWKIPAVEDPHGVADNIRAKSLDHDGARVTTTLMPRGASGA